MTTLVSLLKRAKIQYADHTAIVDREGNLTWGEFTERIARAASLLRQLGIRKGDRFAIISTNSFRQAELIYAGYWTGAIPVPVNFRLAPKEIALILDDCQPEYLFVEACFRDILDAPELSSFRSSCFELPSQSDKAAIVEYETSIYGCDIAHPQEVAEDELAVLIYTGGTTGRSKGVKLTHRNIITNGMQLAEALRIRPSDIYLHVAPMFHSADFIGTGFSMLGAAHAYLSVPTPKTVLEALVETKATVLMLPPTLIIGMLQEPDLQRYDLTGLRCIFYGSAPMAVEWIDKTLASFPDVELVQGYGLTETSPIVTTLGDQEHQKAIDGEKSDRLKSIGRPVMGLDLRIVDDNGQDVKPGQSGEIAVRGGNVTSGYLNLPETTRQAVRDGWFHTGDIAKLDEQGYVYLLDRKKDVIISGGENIYSQEVEAALYQLPHVHEVAVIGVPDDRFGESVFAVIVAKPGHGLTEDEVITHCRQYIGSYKIPRKMAFVDALPKSAVGKILKTELRKTYAET